MRGRILGGNREGQDTAKQACPYLGLAHDQFSHLPEPSSEHRCYLYMQRERIDRSHQQRFCLTTNYTSCPWLVVSPGAAAAGQPGRPWQQYVDALRERFDELERVTMRSRWPKAIVILLLYVAQMIAKGVVAGWRIAAPAVGAFLARLWILLVIGFHRIGSAAKRMTERPARPKAVEAISNVQSIAVAEPGGPRGLSVVEALGDQTSAVPLSNVPSAVNGGRGEPSIPAAPGGTLRSRTRAPTVKWECASCFSYNSPSATFCQRCGRLSSRVEEDLLATEDFFTLDGLKALTAGDEDGAHRYFTLATQANPRSELAWRWLSRTSATVDDVISCLEQMLEAIPDSEEAKGDLQLARLRRDREEELAAARAAAQARVPIPTGPTLIQRVLTVTRRLALELASIPSFVLGLLWLGRLVVDALSSIGVHGLEAMMPIFALPRLMISLPPWLVEPLLPSTFAAADVAPVILAVWYVLLAFRVADGSSGARYAAIVSGLISLGASRWFVVGNGQVFLIAALCLLVLSLIGKDGISQNARGSAAVVARVV